jgi:hypothetical protein
MPDLGPDFTKVRKILTWLGPLVVGHTPIKACYDWQANPGFHHSIAIDFL